MLLENTLDTAAYFTGTRKLCGIKMMRIQVVYRLTGAALRRMR
jgi:hypothetical protein